MISIQAVKSPSGAAEYYTKDNYYTKTEGLGASAWHGKGAAMLGLINKDPDSVKGFAPENGVKATDFAQMLNAQRPDQAGLRNPKLVAEGKQRAAHDLTFGAPKSVSITALMGKNKDIEIMFQESVKKTLDHAEKEYAGVEINRKSGREIKQTGNIVVSVFNHDSNRLGEAHLHSHAVAHNQTFDPEENKLKALNNSAFFKNRYALTQFFYREFESQLNKAGYETRKTEHGSFELVGIEQAMIDKYSTRTKQIRQQVGDKASWHERNKSALDTREVKLDLTHAELEKKWERDLHSDFQIKPDDIRAKLHVHEPASVKESKAELSELTKTAVRSLQNQSNTFTFSQVQRIVGQHQKIAHSPTELMEKFEAHVQRGSIVPHQDNRLGLPLYTTAKTIREEALVVSNYKEAISIGREPFITHGNKMKVASHLTTLKDDTELNADGSLVNIKNNQRNAAETLITSKSSMNILVGRPGSGKSYTLSKIADAIRESKAGTGEGLKITVIAPTHNAKDELTEKLEETDHKVTAKTVRQYIIDHQREQKANLSERQLKHRQWENRNTIVYIDEASQISNKDIITIQAALKHQGIAYTVLAGDTKQNGSLEAGSQLKAAIESGVPTVKIENNARQIHEGDKKIIDALYTKNLKAAWKGLDSKITEDGAYIDNAANSYVERYMKNEDSKKKPYAVAFANKDVNALNTSIHAKLWHEGEIGGGVFRFEQLERIHTEQAVAHLPKNYKPGEKLVFNRDIKNTPFKKNAIFNITDINSDENKLVLTDKDGKQHDWSLTKAKGRLPFEQYEPRLENISQGAKVKFLRKDDQLGVGTKQKGVLTNVSDTTITISSEGKNIKIDRMNKEQTSHIGLAYVDTSFVSQSKTEWEVVVASSGSSPAIGAEATLVALSRHKNSVEIHTDDKETFIEGSKRSRSDELASNFREQTDNSIEARMDKLNKASPSDNLKTTSKIELKIDKPKEREQSISR